MNSKAFNKMSAYRKTTFLTSKVQSAKTIGTRVKYMKQLAEFLKTDGWTGDEILYWFKNIVGFPLEVSTN